MRADARWLVLAVFACLGVSGARAQNAGQSDGTDEADRYAAQRLQFLHEASEQRAQVMKDYNALVAQAEQLWKDGHREDSIDRLRDAIRMHPLNIDANAIMADRCLELAAGTKNEARAAELRSLAVEHQRRQAALVRSITRGTECRRMEDHCTVINVQEEYAVLRSMGLRSGGQSLVVGGGSTYDMLDATAGDGSRRQVYFDIGLFFP